MRDSHSLLSLVVLGFILMFPTIGRTQQWSGVLDPSRGIDWSAAGAGAIPPRNTICATLNPGVTSAQIASAISGCPSGQTVFLNSGTYTLSAGINFGGKSNVTLRGAGPDHTFIVLTGNANCGGFGGSGICMWSGGLNGMYVDSSTAPGHVANWTANFAKGTTTVTLDSTAGLAVGGTMMFDQCEDGLTGATCAGSATDTGNIFVCDATNTCSIEGAGGGGRTEREQNQLVTVTAINGNNVTFTPGIYMPNWRSSQTPQAWWGNTPYIASAVGLENLSVDHTNSGAQNGIFMFNCVGCWIKNIRSIKPNRNHVWLYQSPHATIRDSYFFAGGSGGSQSYGIEWFHTSDDLVENNIFQQVTLPLNVNAAGSGSVIAYNFIMDDVYTVSPTWMQGSNQHHDAGVDNILHEGNIGSGFVDDDTHGTGNFLTAFRNYFIGWETGKTAQTIAVHIYADHRYMNIIGNVLGRPGYHTNYECAPAAPTTSSCGNGNSSIFTIGWSGNGGARGPFNNDLLAKASLMRWGNYDTVNAAVRFVNAEVPSNFNDTSGSPSLYVSAIPSNQTLPASFYLNSKPSWWPSTKPWPPIGPDVTGGNIPGVGGHAYTIPTQDCYNNIMGGSVDGSGSVLTFNAASCYVAGPLPSPPTGLRAVVD